MGGWWGCRSHSPAGPHHIRHSPSSRLSVLGDASSWERVSKSGPPTQLLQEQRKDSARCGGTLMLSHRNGNSECFEETAHSFCGGGPGPILCQKQPAADPGTPMHNSPWAQRPPQELQPPQQGAQPSPVIWPPHGGCTQSQCVSSFIETLFPLVREPPTQQCTSPTVPEPLDCVSPVLQSPSGLGTEKPLWG